MTRSWQWLFVALALGSAAAPLAAEGGCAVPPGLAAERPDPVETATRVAVGLYVIDILVIDDVHQSLTGDFFFALSWNDPRLATEALGVSLSGCSVSLTEIWHPDVHVLNQRELTRQLPEIAEVDGLGGVIYRQRFFGDLSVPVVLYDFPFDEQVLRFTVASRYSPDEVELAVDEKRSGRLDELSLTGWVLQDSEVEVTTLAVAGRELSVLEARVVARRDAGFFVFKVLTPLSLIVAMAWMVFWINPSQLPPQVGLSTASVLTLIAFQFSLVHLLPRLSYLTRIDKFVLASTVLVFLALGEAILTGRLAHGGREELAVRIDRWARVLYPVLFALLAWMALGS